MHPLFLKGSICPRRVNLVFPLILSSSISTRSSFPLRHWSPSSFQRLGGANVCSFSRSTNQTNGHRGRRASAQCASKKYYASSFGIGPTPQSKSQRLSYGLNELLRPISHSRSGVQQLDWAPCARVFMRPVNLSPPQWKKSVCDEFTVTIGLCQLAKRNPFRFICTKSGASVC